MQPDSSNPIWTVTAYSLAAISPTKQLRLHKYCTAWRAPTERHPRYISTNPPLDPASILLLSSYLHFSFSSNSYPSMAKSMTLQSATRKRLIGKPEKLLALDSQSLDPTTKDEDPIVFGAGSANRPLTKEASWSESCVEMGVPWRTKPAKLILGVSKARAMALLGKH